MRTEGGRRIFTNIPNRCLPLLKVCGITRREDAEVSIDAGANALGFNFYPPSPRFVSRGTAEELVSQLPEEVLSIAVIVCRKGDRGWIEPSPATLERPKLDLSAYDLPDLIDIVQVHGLQGGVVPEADKPLLVAVSAESASDFPDQDIIIDTSWGRGEQADWEEVGKLDRDYILSGGLNPENIETALRTLNPAGIDVCSGVESEPGRKDHPRLRAFLEKAGGYYRLEHGIAVPQTRSLDR